MDNTNMACGWSNERHEHRDVQGGAPPGACSRRSLCRILERLFQRPKLNKTRYSQRRGCLQRNQIPKGQRTNASKATKAILWALVEAETGGKVFRLATDSTIEHIMPRKLTEDWKKDLEEEAEKIINNNYT